MPVEMAAFIGERNCEILGEKWFYEEELNCVMVRPIARNL